MPFLIDGHNVIAALPDIDLEDPYDEAKLVLKLRAWAARIRRRAIVVFDGGIPGGPSRTLSTVDVKVIFAARFHTNADRIIRERIRNLPDAPNWTVVSSDHEILDEAKAAGTRVITAQVFAENIDRPVVEKEKPETISPAEVEAWLEIFQEPEEEDATPPPPASPPARPAVVRRRKRSKQKPHRSPPSPGHTRTIGDQLGMDVEPEPTPEESIDKPSGLSRREVEAWLEVFHDDPESHVPPPNLPPRQPRPGRPKKEPVVRKDGTLSEDEVDTWLNVFEQGGRSDENLPKTAKKPRQVNPKLAKHQEKFAPTEDEKEPQISDEDLELWHRLFGEE